MGLILIGSNLSGLKSWVDITNQHKEQIFSKTKRPTTYLIPVTEKAPYWIIGKHNTSAFRFAETLFHRFLFAQMQIASTYPKVASTSCDEALRSRY